MLMLILFTVTTVLVNLNSDSWQILFFIITLGTVVLLNSKFTFHYLIKVLINIFIDAFSWEFYYARSCFQFSQFF